MWNFSFIYKILKLIYSQKVNHSKFLQHVAPNSQNQPIPKQYIHLNFTLKYYFNIYTFFYFSLVSVFLKGSF